MITKYELENNYTEAMGHRCGFRDYDNPCYNCKVVETVKAYIQFLEDSVETLKDEFGNAN